MGALNSTTKTGVKKTPQESWYTHIIFQVLLNLLNFVAVSIFVYPRPTKVSKSFQVVHIGSFFFRGPWNAKNLEWVIPPIKKWFNLSMIPSTDGHRKRGPSSFVLFHSKNSSSNHIRNNSIWSLRSAGGFLFFNLQVFCWAFRLLGWSITIMEGAKQLPIFLLGASEGVTLCTPEV